MDKTDHPRLTPDAILRIERACTQAHGLLRFGEVRAKLAEFSWNHSLIGTGREDRVEAPGLGGLLIAEAKDSVAIFYFSAMAYEYFLIAPSVDVLEDDLVRVAAIAAAEFHLDTAVFAGTQQHWVARASGRDKINTAKFERAPPSFWKELFAEFNKLDAADVSAVSANDGSWVPCGGPTDETERFAVYERILNLAWRAVSVLGVQDRNIALAVWLDAVAVAGECSLREINQLSFGCADFCTELEKRSTGTEPTGIASIGKETHAQRAARRKTFIDPILDAKSLTRSGWAARAGVDPSVVYDYLDGISTPRPNNREALAQAIGLSVADLPR
jgi:hypothetical protein